MYMHRLMTKIIFVVCGTVLSRFWYLLAATMNFLRNPSTHFPSLAVTVMNERRTTNYSLYSGTEAPVKERSPLLCACIDLSPFRVKGCRYAVAIPFTLQYISIYDRYFPIHVLE